MEKTCSGCRTRVLHPELCSTCEPPDFEVWNGGPLSDSELSACEDLSRLSRPEIEWLVRLLRAQERLQRAQMNVLRAELTEFKSACEPSRTADQQDANIKTDPKKPVCKYCNDTHWVHSVIGGTVLCQYCPVPCQKCREGGNGPFCAKTPCDCECHAKKEEAK